MCGIAGILQLDKKPISTTVLSNMVTAIAHRGPDGSGMEVRGPVGLGHRRLAIIDPQSGAQPLSNEDGQVWITFNGEIYNYKELRLQLESYGHQFRTNSDTETIVHAYEQWGDRCVDRLRGMFAFGIMDWRRNRMFIARDHLGIKPLYYWLSSKCFVFASELQAFRFLPDQSFELDLQALDQYLCLQYIPSPRTIFRQIQKLPPAHRMSVALDGTVSNPEEYWQLEFSPNYQRSESEWLDALDAVLRESVRSHLVADVPFGAFLSGGVDSSAIVAYMSQILDQPVRTFSIGFHEETFNELPYAQQVAQRWQTEHHVEIVKSDALEILPRLVRHYGEPFGDSSAIPTYYVSQMARHHVPMVLSGDGGDELFAGYESYRAWLRWLHFDASPCWRRVLHPLAERLMPWRYKPRNPSLFNWMRLIQCIGPNTRLALWRPEYRTICNLPMDVMEEAFTHTISYPPCTAVQYMDIKNYLPQDILTKVDIASMMHGLEVRTPFVDLRVAEFAATIPQSLSISRNASGEWEGKRLLKKLLQRYYPSEFVQRPKMGFSVPLSNWFGATENLDPLLQEKLLGNESTLQKYFEPTGVAKLLTDRSAAPIWLLLFLEEWLRQYSNRKP